MLQRAANQALIATITWSLLFSSNPTVWAGRTIDSNVVQEGATFSEATKPALETYDVGEAVRIEIAGVQPVGTIFDVKAGRALSASGVMVAPWGSESASHVMTVRHVANGFLSHLTKIGKLESDLRATQFDASGNPTTHNVLVVWAHPGEGKTDDLSILRVAGESEVFAIPAEEGPLPGEEFRFVGFGFAGADNNGGHDLGNDGSRTHDDGIDTRMGIPRLGMNVVSGYDLETREVLFDVDIQGNDPLNDGGPHPLETKANAFDSGSPLLVDTWDGTVEVFGMVRGKPAGIANGQFATGGPSVPAHHAWIERTMELDDQLHELRVTGVDAANDLVDGFGTPAVELRQALQEGLASLYTSQGAIAHAELDLPNASQFPAARFLLAAEAMNRLKYAAMVRDTAVFDVLDSDSHPLATTGCDIDDVLEMLIELMLDDVIAVSLAEADSAEGADADELVEATLAISRAQAAYGEWETIETYGHLNTAYVHLAKAVGSSASDLTVTGTVTPQADGSDKVEIEVLADDACTPTYTTAEINLGYARLPVKNAQVIDLHCVEGGWDIEFEGELLYVETETAEITVHTVDGCGQVTSVTSVICP